MQSGGAPALALGNQDDSLPVYPNPDAGLPVIPNPDDSLPVSGDVASDVVVPVAETHRGEEDDAEIEDGEKKVFR
jgi:hypothetical protein